MSKFNHIVILGSSRSFGNARKAVQELIGCSFISIIDLNQKMSDLLENENAQSVD